MKTILIALTVISQMAFANSNANSTKGISQDSIYNLETPWTNQDNKSMELKSFSGKPMVISMVYTSCQHACPMTVADLQKIENGLKKNKKDVQFVLASFDPKRDTPEALNKFAKKFKLDLSYWSLITSTPEAIRDLAAVLNVQYKDTGDGDFSHSNIITVLDSNGKIIHQQTGLKQDPKETIQSLLHLLNKKI